MELTDKQCEDFLRLSCSFNDMVRTIYAAGFKEGYKSATIPDEGRYHVCLLAQDMNGKCIVCGKQV